MSSAAEVCVAEADNGAVMVLIAGTVFVGLWLVLAIDIMGNGIGVGTELYDAEWYAGSGKGVPHAVCAYHGVDIVCWGLGLLCQCGCDVEC